MRGVPHDDRSGHPLRWLRGLLPPPSARLHPAPAAEAFDDLGAYYATAFHELVHWTGDEARCARTFGKRFGDEAYAVEELVAELGSAFLCRRFQVDGTLRHPEYLGHWLGVLRGDRKALFVAASRARRAADYLVDPTPAAATEV